MRNVLTELRTGVVAALFFVVLVALSLLLLSIFDKSGFESVTNALSGVAGVAGALVAIVLAVVALMVSRTAEISQSPEYQAAFRAYRAVWELDGLTQSLLIEPSSDDVELRKRVIDVVFSADLLMFLKAMESYPEGSRSESHSLRRNLLKGSGDFLPAVENLRNSAVASLGRLHSGEVKPGRHTFIGFVQRVVQEVGMPDEAMATSCEKA